MAWFQGRIGTCARIFGTWWGRGKDDRDGVFGGGVCFQSLGISRSEHRNDEDVVSS